MKTETDTLKRPGMLFLDLKNEYTSLTGWFPVQKVPALSQFICDISEECDKEFWREYPLPDYQI